MGRGGKQTMAIYYQTEYRLGRRGEDLPWEFGDTIEWH